MARVALKRTVTPTVRSKPLALYYPREWIRPCLASEMFGQVPTGSRWVREIKFDGYRTQIHLRGDDAVLYSRNGHDWTSRYKALADAVTALSARHAVVDAEVTVPRADGNCDYWTLQKDVAAGESSRLIAYCFDILFLDGRDLRSLPLLERKAILADLLTTDKTARLRFSESIECDGPAFYREAHAKGLEGVISKVAVSPYRSDRVGTWVKTVCQYREVLPIIGFAIKDGEFNGFYLAKHHEGQLIYGGKVEDGFDDALARAFPSELAPFVSKRCVLDHPPDKPKARWLGRMLPAHIVHRGGYGPNRVRHAKFEGFAETAQPQRTTPALPVVSRSSVPAKNILQLLPDAVVPSREQLRAHWRRVANDALAHLARRPLKLVRHYEGTTYYHKGPLPPVPRAVHKLRIRKSDGTEGVRLWVDDVAGLLGLADMGIVEVHPWAAKVDNIENPDLMVFDLDPGEGIQYPFVIETALLLRDLLSGEGFASWPKVTGGKGLHVMVPLEPDLTHKAVHTYAKEIATCLAATDRGRYTTMAGAANRIGKLFIDVKRNGRGCTAIGTWSPRALQGFPIAKPVTWDDIERGIRPDAFTLGNVRAGCSPSGTLRRS